MDGQRLALEHGDVERGRLVDEAEPALRRDQLSDVAQMPVGLGSQEHEGRGADAECRDLGRQRLRMVDHVVRAHLAHPGSRLGTGGGGDDNEVGERTGDLDSDRADAAGAADDDDGVCGARHRLADVQPVEQHLPRGDRGQRDGGGGGPVERFRLVTDDALIDEVELTVGAGPADRPGVEYLVARAKQRDVGSDRRDPARGVPTQHLPGSGIRQGVGPALDVDRVDRHRPDLDQDVAALGNRHRLLDVDQGFLAVNAAGLLVADRTHLSSPFD